MLLHLGRASFLAAAQMCFCPLKRKSPLKPAKFFIDYYEDGENFQTPLSDDKNNAQLRSASRDES